MDETLKAEAAKLLKEALVKVLENEIEEALEEELRKRWSILQGRTHIPRSRMWGKAEMFLRRVQAMQATTTQLSDPFLLKQKE